METYINDIEQYASRLGVNPKMVLRLSINASWGCLDEWRNGTASPTIATVHKIYKYMNDNPVSRSQPYHKGQALRKA